MGIPSAHLARDLERGGGAPTAEHAPARRRGFAGGVSLLGALSACPGGDCASRKPYETVTCYPLLVEVYKPPEGALAGWSPPRRNGYSRTHGMG